VIDDKALLAAIDEGRVNSYGTDEKSSLGKKRAQALEAYLGLNTNPAPEGRSQVVDRTVYQTVHTILPSLVRIFASSSESVCKFVPIGPDDEQAAEQTTAVINHFVTQMNPWEQIVSDWIHDASLLCNGYTMAYWDEPTGTIRETYEGQSDDQLAMLLSDTQAKIVQHTKNIDEQMTADAQAAYQQQFEQWQMAAQAGQQVPPPQPPQPVTLHDVVIERPDGEEKPCIRVVPPEHCYVSTHTANWTLLECPYFEIKELRTIAYLRGLGLTVPIDISDEEDDDSEEGTARDRFGESIDPDGKGVMREVWSRTIWVDANDGDRAAKWYVIAVGRTILFKEEANSINVASMTPQPLPHRHPGMSIAETVVPTQNVKTAIKRGALDNLYLANNGRHVISSKVNLADFLDARPGGVVRMLDDAMPGDGHVLPLVHPVMFDQVIGSLEYFDQDAQNLTGASRYFSGTDANAINKTASGTIALQNMAAMRVEHIARMMAPAFERLFEIVHELVSKHRNKPITIQLRGNWVTVDPQAWKRKRDVRISVGVGAGNKESMMQQLTMMFGAQLQLAPMGLATPENMRATVVEMAKLNGFANPDKFWNDPQKNPPQPGPLPPEVLKIQADKEKSQFEAQQDQAKFQAQMQLDSQREEMQARQKTLEQQMQLEHDARLKGLDHQHQAEMDARKMAFDKWAKEFDAAVKITLADKSAQAGAEQAQITKTPDDRLAQAVNQIMAELQDAKAHRDSPAEIVRDQNGRAVGLKRGENVRQILRGPDGRPTGLQ
jgi:hypothetical protein